MSSKGWEVQVSKSGVPAVVKTADGREVLVREAIFLMPIKTPHGAGLVCVSISLCFYSDTVILNGDKLVVITGLPSSVNNE